MTASTGSPARQFAFTRALRSWAPAVGLTLDDRLLDPTRALAKAAPEGVPDPWKTLGLVLEATGTSPGWRVESPLRPNAQIQDDVKSWDALADLIKREGGVVFTSKRPRSWPDEGLPRLQVWAEAAGFEVRQPREHERFHAQANLVSSGQLGWIARASDAANLLVRMMHLHDDPGRVRVVFRLGDREVRGDERWVDVLATVKRGTHNAGGVISELSLIIERHADVAAPTATGADPGSLLEPGLEDLMLALDQAEATAPRGFVGLKVFRERMLAPGTSLELRRELLERAAEAAIVRIGSQADPKNGQPVATIALNRDHPAVREILGADGASLPPAVELRGEPLSATIVRQREAER